MVPMYMGVSTGLASVTRQSGRGRFGLIVVMIYLERRRGGRSVRMGHVITHQAGLAGLGWGVRGDGCRWQSPRRSAAGSFSVGANSVNTCLVRMARVCTVVAQREGGVARGQHGDAPVDDDSSVAVGGRWTYCRRYIGASEVHEGGGRGEWFLPRRRLTKAVVGRKAANDRAVERGPSRFSPPIEGIGRRAHFHDWDPFADWRAVE